MIENDELKTGSRQLDDMIGGGLPRGEFMLVGGCPWIGKTSFLKQIMKHNEETACLYLSDDSCFAYLPFLIDALCQATNFDCFVVMDDLDRFRVGEEELGYRLKVMARQFDIPIIGAVSLSRDLEERPVIRDFHKDFVGVEPSIEDGADVVVGLYRESYYTNVEEEDSKDELSVLKNRHGCTGSIDVCFDRRYRTWREVSVKDVCVPPKATEPPPHGTA